MVRHVHITRHRVPGVLQITATGWDGQIFRMSRQAYFEWQRNESLAWKEASAVYVLYADHFDKGDGKFLYVGRTVDPIRRGREHEVAKPDWTAALIFTSSGDWMSATHVESIEARFIEWAKSTSRYTVNNRNEGAADPHAGKADQLLINAYLSPLPEIVEMAGIDIFSPNPRGIFEFQASHPGLRTANGCSAQIIDATSGEVEVFADSQLWVSLERDGEEKTPIRDQVSELVSSGCARVEKDVLTFLKSTRVFVTTTVTSQRLLGHSLSSWRDANRRPLSDALKVSASRLGGITNSHTKADHK